MSLGKFLEGWRVSQPGQQSSSGLSLIVFGQRVHRSGGNWLGSLRHFPASPGCWVFPALGDPAQSEVRRPAGELVLWGGRHRSQRGLQETGLGPQVASHMRKHLAGGSCGHQL